MPRAPTLLRHLRRLAGTPPGGGPTDHELPHRFVAARDEHAFAALLQRRGRLLWSTCRRVLVLGALAAVGAALGQRSAATLSAERHAVRVDAYGDPLPHGAVGRLGALRWRHEGEATSMAFAPDGKV